MTNESIFSGLRVLDCSTFVAAPSAAAVLSDFGAEVIKVEPPGGDTQRILGSVPPMSQATANYNWHMTDRNKRGMCVNLKASGAKEILGRLVKWADVVITNFPHGTREKLHLGYDEVSAWNPGVIYADVTGFGDAGPDAALPGFDITAYWSRSGLLTSTRDAGSPPTVPVSGSGDYATGIALYSAIVTALYNRERTGKGANVGVSLLAAGIWAGGTVVAGALAHGTPYRLHDPATPVNPLMNPYRSSDDRWFMLVVEPQRWPALAKALGNPELGDDPRFADSSSRATNSADLTAALAAAFGSRPFSDWREALDGERITYGLIQAPEEVIHDPQLRPNDIIVPLEGADGMDEIISSPIVVRGLQKVPARRAPELGEHNNEVLLELGFSAAEIAGFRANGTLPATVKGHAA